MSPDVNQPILPRIATGDSGAVKECMERYGALVWSIARRMAPSPTDAEDAAQEIFVELWKSAARFDESKASEPAFIAMIARRRMIDRLRAQQRRPQTTAIPEDFDIPSDDHLVAERSIEASLAMRALDTLKPEHRRIILLSVVHGLSHGEISEKTEIPLAMRE